MSANQARSRKRPACWLMSVSSQQAGRLRLRWRVLLGTVLLVAAGCLPSQTTSPIVDARRPQVKVGAPGLLSDDIQQAALSREAFMGRVADLLAKDRPGAARRLIERYPDLARESLRCASCEQARQPVLQTVARVFDEQCERVDPGAGWLAVLRQRVEQPERFRNYDSARTRLTIALGSGRPKVAAEISLPSPPSGPAETLLSLDRDELTARALLRADRSAEAVKVLRRAAETSGTSFPYESVHLLLQLSEALRSAGQAAEAASTWRGAVEMATDLLAGRRPVNDPIAWEHLSALRPVNTPWPAAVAEHLQHDRPAESEVRLVAVGANRAAAQTWADEAAVWTAIGHWRLDRGEAQAALLAFKRAESATADDVGKERLRLDRASALIDMGEPVRATELLVRLAASSSPMVSRPSLAMLGALKFQQGQVEPNLAFLKKAVEEDDSGGWPGRNEAEADLGLAYLTMRDEANGLLWLHTAQKHFEQSHQRPLLLQCLENEAAYQEQMGKTQEAAALRQRRHQLETNEAARAE